MFSKMMWAVKYDVNYQDSKQSSIWSTGTIVNGFEMWLKNVIS